MNNSVNLAGLTGLLSEYSKEIQEILVEQQQRDEQEQQSHINSNHYTPTQQTDIRRQK